MKVSATCLATAALACAAVAGGCGFGPGDAAEGQAELRVTREFGTVPMVDATLEDPTESDTVIRFLDENADIESSYGDNFVDSIDGYAGSTSGGGAEDWFFFVNGYYSDIGSGETEIRPGDRIWWDYRYWSAAYRVPAVVGSWPEPFLHGYDGERPDTVLECVRAEPETCADVVVALKGAGIEFTVDEPKQPVEHPDELRILVGTWDAVGDDAAASQLDRGPRTSGVYASFEPCGGTSELVVDDDHGRPARRLADGGLVAAVREGEDQPTWLVTGTGDDAVAAAAALLGPDDLRDRYAVAVAGGETIPAPAATGSGETDGGCG
ncbi:MAG: DUF4430 domain-containing protein [Solirubrobacterales bacterium]